MSGPAGFSSRDKGTGEAAATAWANEEVAIDGCYKNEQNGGANDSQEIKMISGL
jgi:hypothetical protein